MTTTTITASAGNGRVHVVPTIPDVVAHEWDFWGARAEITHICNFALARMVSPWAVLGWALEIAIYHIPPWIKLPAIIGRRASLNLFLAIVASTSLGKGASLGAAEDAFNFRYCEPVYTVPVGSGEGLAKQYAHWETKGGDDGKGGQVPDRNAVLFTATEVDTLLTQEKVAVGLAVLTNRAEEHLRITVEDWELARAIMQMSTQVRTSVQVELKREGAGEQRASPRRSRSGNRGRRPADQGGRPAGRKGAHAEAGRWRRLGLPLKVARSARPRPGLLRARNRRAHPRRTG